MHTGDFSSGVTLHCAGGAVGGDAEIQGGEVIHRELGDSAALFEAKLPSYLLQVLISLVLLPGDSPVEQLGPGSGEVEIVSESK